jgi:uncharacterized membrane protein
VAPEILQWMGSGETLWLEWGHGVDQATMKNKRIILILMPLGVTLFSAGCVGTGPNTQAGAVSGGMLGAIAGAIIGNNTGSGNSAEGALIGAAAGAILGGTMGNQADHQQGTIYGSQREATTTVVSTMPPPPPAVAPPEVVSARTAPEAIWIEGHWVYNSQGYYWEPGRWEIPPPRYRQYVAPHWERQGEGYVYIRGYWRS